MQGTEIIPKLNLPLSIVITDMEPKRSDSGKSTPDSGKRSPDSGRRSPDSGKRSPDSDRSHALRSSRGKNRYLALPEIPEESDTKKTSTIAEKKVFKRQSLPDDLSRGQIEDLEPVPDLRQRSSSVCEPRNNKLGQLNPKDLITDRIDRLALVDAKIKHEALIRKEIKKEIIFAMNFINTLYSIPEIIAKYKEPNHYLLNSYQKIITSAEFFDYITALNMKAQKHKVYFCFNDEGKLIKLHKLLESIKFENSAKIQKKEVDEFFQEKKQQKVDLKINHPSKVFSDNDKVCYEMILKLHSDDSQTFVYPLHFMNYYNKLVGTPRIIQLIALAIASENEISFIQKMRILNFIQTLLKFKPATCDEAEVKNAFTEVIVACNKTNVVEIIQFCNEIELSFTSKKLHLRAAKTQLNIDSFIHKILNENCEFKELDNFINQISNDLKLISALSIYNTMPDDLIIENSITPASILWKNVVKYFCDIHEQIITNSNTSLEIQRLTLVKFIFLLINVDFSLVKNKEFLVSNAIFCVLYRIKAKSELKNYIKSAKKERLALSQKIKPSEKSDPVDQFLRRLKELKKIHCGGQAFKLMRDLITECRIQRKFFVPHVIPISLMARKELENLNFNKEWDSDEMEKSYQKSLILRNTSKILDDVRYHAAKEIRVKRLHTDIQNKLYPEEIKLEEKKPDIIPRLQLQSL
jgi:hypothetical protein